ncbi:CAP domain-containing protein [Lewinella sp. W8]|uniref:CAP domain-containing protein n=1 Tax=Lewinella sp. W8 TaxID=2528208 RepID=UPI0010674159|nr:CAP domain-containing protein [Lewinella sp. W8]
MQRIFSFLLFALLFTACQTDLTFGDPVFEDPEAPTTEDTNSDVSNEELTMAQQALNLVNATRAEGCRCGNTLMPPVAPLEIDERLMIAAQLHSEDQAQMNRMQHQGSDGSRVSDRVTRTGYRWRRVGENVAWNYPNIASVVQGWFNSEGHCLNLMNANFQHMGFGESNRYWTQVFATE